MCTIKYKIQQNYKYVSNILIKFWFQPYSTVVHVVYTIVYIYNIHTCQTESIKIKIWKIIFLEPLTTIHLNLCVYVNVAIIPDT